MYHIKEKVKISGDRIAERIINNIIWGKGGEKVSDMEQEIINEAKRLCANDKTYE